MKNIKLFEVFAGIGSQYKALKNISKKMKWKVEIVGIIEWFIPAICAYNKMHLPNKRNSLSIESRERERERLEQITLSLDSKKPIANSSIKKIINKYFGDILLSEKKLNNTFDITKTQYFQISKNIDIFTYSFPCQDLSNQGRQKGMEKNSKTRSSLLWEVDRLLSDMKKNWKIYEMPKYLLLENVSQIGNYKNRKSLNEWISKLNKIGYETKIYYLNSSNFDSPQNRKRAYGLSIRKDWKEKMNFIFPDFESIIKKNKKPLKCILDKKVEQSYFLKQLDKFKKTDFVLTKSNINKSKLIGYTNFSSEAYVYDINFTGPTLTASGANSRIKIIDSNKIRKLNAKEALKYMGFNESDYKKIKKTNLNETKIIYLAGNSIVVNVLEKIFESLKF